MKQQTLSFFAILFCKTFLFYTCTSYGVAVITGDSEIAGQTFTFTINQHVQDRLGRMRANAFVPPGSLTFFGADASAAGTSGDYAVSVLSRGKDSVLGITPETAFVNKQQGVANPLHNAGIQLMTLLEGETSFVGEFQRPAVVIDGQEQNVYMITMYEGSTKQVLSALDIKDAASAVTSGIVGLAGARATVFAAVKPNGGDFGDADSGIAVVVLGTAGEDGEGFFSDIQAQTGMLGVVGKAFPLDVSSDLLKTTTADLAAIGQVVDLHWDINFERLYIALQTTNGAGATDGSRALVVGHFELETDENGEFVKDIFGTFKRSAKLVLNEFAPASVFSGVDNIVGAVGADEQVSIAKVRTMFTSTGLPYVIVQGNVGAPSAVSDQVFALPVVSSTQDDDVRGVLARKDLAPEDSFGINGRFGGRGFTDPATTPAHAPLQTDDAAKVGAGPLTFGDISDMYVQRDTVFVTVRTATAGQTPGVYFSQALFDADGVIKGWSQWQRAITTLDSNGDVEKIDGAFLDSSTGEYIVLSPTLTDTQTIVKRTEFASGDDALSASLVEQLAQDYQQQDGGLFGLFDIVPNSPGLKDISLLLAVGQSSASIIETGHIDASGYVPTAAAEYNVIERFVDGAIIKNFPGAVAKIVTVSGGVLDDIGPLQAAEIATDGTDGWMLVGGARGIAILSRDDGSGWDTSMTLSTNLSGLTDDMSFKEIEGYENVHKIIFDEPHFVYVLTDKKLDRIDLSVGTPGLGGAVATTIATVTDFGNANGVLHDVIVSGKFAMLASSAGLFRIGNDANVQTAASAQEARWARLDLPSGTGVARRLVATSATGRSQAVASFGVGGQVYVLDAYRGYNRSRLYRFAVKNVSGGAIDDETVQQIPDLFFEGQLSFLASLGEFRDYLATDGALLMHSRSQNGVVPRNVKMVSSQVRSGFAPRSIGTLAPVEFDGGAVINALTRNSATGGFVVAGDFGLRINE